MPAMFVRINTCLSALLNKHKNMLNKKHAKGLDSTLESIAVCVCVRAFATLPKLAVPIFREYWRRKRCNPVISTCCLKEIRLYPGSTAWSGGNMYIDLALRKRHCANIRVKILPLQENVLQSKPYLRKEPKNRLTKTSTTPT